MVDDKYFWFSQAFSFVVMFYIFYRIYSLYISSEKLNKMIEDHYSLQNLTIESISKLNFTERLKFGEPIFGYFRLYNYSFGIMTSQIEYTRKVELIDNKENELTKYVELVFRNKKLVEFKEFGSFDL